MKRSDMVQLVSEKFADYTKNSPQTTPQGLTDWFLSQFEKQGMIPPGELENVTGYIKYYGPGFQVEEDVEYHTDFTIFWEK